MKRITLYGMLCMAIAIVSADDLIIYPDRPCGDFNRNLFGMATLGVGSFPDSAWIVNHGGLWNRCDWQPIEINNLVSFLVRQ